MKRVSIFLLVLALSHPLTFPSIVRSQSANNNVDDEILLNFEPRDLRNPKTPPSSKSEVIKTTTQLENDFEITDEDLFEGDSDSLMTIAIGSAEGTRTPNGERTKHFVTHRDPGNGVLNQGSFSLQVTQYLAKSPEDADQFQLRRLRRQFNLGLEQAQQKGLTLNLSEKLNLADLANQAPLAALDTGGFIDRLYEVKNKGLQGDSAILEARTLSYIDPRTNKLNAPGLGGTLESVRRDQARRQDEIKKAKEVQLPKLKSKIKSRKK